MVYFKHLLYGYMFISLLLLHVYCTGWLYKLEVKNMDELKALMDEKAYEEYLKEDSDDEKQPI